MRPYFTAFPPIVFGAVFLIWAANGVQAQSSKPVASLPILPEDKMTNEILDQYDVTFEDLLERTLKSGVIRKTVPAMTSNVISVGQAQAAVTTLETGRARYLQSGGAQPCVLLTIYSPSKQIAALAHLDAGTAVGPSVRAMVKRMGLGTVNDAEARLTGGYKTLSTNIFIESIYHLQKAGIRIVETRTKRGGFTPKSDSALINAETGEVYDIDSFPKDQPKKNQEHPIHSPVSFALGSIGG